MNSSPLILLVFWFVINILIKSAKDKKKIEEARNKRTQQIESRPIQNKTAQTIQRDTPNRNLNKNRNIIDVFKEEIEKEINRERQMKPVISEQKANLNKTVNEKVIEKKTSVRDEYFSVNTDINYDKSLEEIKTYYRKPSLNIKNDLLKGIIFAEILSEPKSLQNRKRSM